MGVSFLVPTLLLISFPSSVSPPSLHLPSSLDERICSPPFMVLNTECGPDTLEKIEKHGLTFPFSKSLPFLFDRGRGIVTWPRWLHRVLPPSFVGVDIRKQFVVRGKLPNTLKKQQPGFSIHTLATPQLVYYLGEWCGLILMLLFSVEL